MKISDVKFMPTVLCLMLSTVIIQGRITMKGKGIHAYPAITTSDGVEYMLVGKLAKTTLKKYQNQTISINGEIIQQKAGPGFPAKLEIESIIDDSKKNRTD